MTKLMAICQNYHPNQNFSLTIANVAQATVSSIFYPSTFLNINNNNYLSILIKILHHTVAMYVAMCCLYICIKVKV